ncbi:MAG: Holliday junction branch migration protein RuvA [Bacteroidota bacterium]|nr:Holliday junction branch migration protein RuvA [Bacteroidota bacterium]
MYEFIQGKVSGLTPAYAVIQTGGFGYFIHISLNSYSQITNSQKENSSADIKLFLHQVVREDAHLLFGFFTEREREIFRHLISVSGIGANTARMMLSSLNPLELQKAIAGGEVNVLKGVKGIGLKTAQRIIIDLKDKIGLDSSVDENFMLANNTIKEEALSALVTLGFSKSVVEKLVDKLLAIKPDMAVEELIKQTLKNI